MSSRSSESVEIRLEENKKDINFKFLRSCILIFSLGSLQLGKRREFAICNRVWIVFIKHNIQFIQIQKHSLVSLW